MNIQILSLYLRTISMIQEIFNKSLPFIIDSFDDETQGRTDAVDIFTHDFLNDSRFASIVKATAVWCCVSGVQHEDWATYSIKIRISLSLSLAFRKIDNILEFCL